METFKSAFGVTKAFVPVLYFSGLLFYFLHVSGGSIHQAWEIGLGPTILGLGAIGLLFCIPLAIKLARIYRGPRTPGSGGGTSVGDDDDGFDADAVVARYLAQRPAETAPNRPAARPSPRSAGPAKPAGFGRKIS